MQRKLIDYKVFEKLNEKSLSKAQYELVEASKLLSAALKVGPLSFHSFDQSNVIYETANHTFLHATYKVDQNRGVLFDNIEEIVIDEETHNKHFREKIGDMVEAVLEDKTAKADELFKDVISLVRDTYKRESALRRGRKITESVMDTQFRKKGSDGDMMPTHDKQKFPHMKTSGRGKVAKLKDKVVLKARGVKKHIEEWLQLVQNVLGYIEFQENGKAYAESAVATNDKGDVVSVHVPTVKQRNEGKILMAQWKTLKADVKVMRENAKRLPNDREFCESLKVLKRHNNMVDANALQESLESILSKYPHLIYLTQSELSGLVSESLANAGTGNYDDRTCDLMAEGILRTAHHAFTDRVERILNLANAKVEENVADKYAAFQNVISDFYPKLDESSTLEMKVFADLYTAALDVRQVAEASKQDKLRQEATDFATDLKMVLEGEEMPSLQLASNVATWLQTIVETNLEDSDWKVEKEPHVTVVGDHPVLFDKAKKPYTPATDFSGDWGDPLPQISGDKVGYKNGASEETRNRSWGNKGGAEVWPSLDNPYVPNSPMDRWTMKGGPGVDKTHDADGEAQWQSGDTWPELNNPYVPQAVKVHVSDDNRVDNMTNP